METVDGQDRTLTCQRIKIKQFTLMWCVIVFVVLILTVLSNKQGQNKFFLIESSILNDYCDFKIRKKRIISS